MNPTSESFNTSFGKSTASRSGVDIFACYQCEKCTNGCPLTFAMDVMPHALIRMAQVGMADEVRASRTPWVCASCETCVTRCPNLVDVPRLMDFLKQDAAESGAAPVEPDVAAFHATFMDNIRLFGRVQETVLMGIYQLKSLHGPGDLASPNVIENVKLGLKMVGKGRMSLIPRISGKLRDRVRKLF